MYLHVSKKLKISNKNIIGIFDMDTASVGKDTKQFLSRMQKRGSVRSEIGDIPKSFVMYDGENGTEIALLKFSSGSVENKVNAYDGYFGME